MSQLALLDMNNELFALDLGLHGMASNKKPGSAVTPLRAGCVHAIQGRPGAQVALLQSLVSLTVLLTEHTLRKTPGTFKTPINQNTAPLRADMR